MDNIENQRFPTLPTDTTATTNLVIFYKKYKA